MLVTFLHLGLKHQILHPTVHYGNVWLLQIGNTQSISKTSLMWRHVACRLLSALFQSFFVT
ncbi:hypothetical protein Lalb_Chr06g0172331 [Lupinus albus]|uniref:Uncharacterized protein n=1 Tax=Lupinus albus TaxID=3870 RepID=A0A6A4QGK0_LUPAL|nr:hypothetical protein Lalb_Chr06g0172331 [Lupinus albus]